MFIGKAVGLVDAEFQLCRIQFQFRKARADRVAVVEFHGVGQAQEGSQTATAVKERFLHFVIGRSIRKDRLERGAHKCIHTAYEADHERLRAEIVVILVDGAGERLRDVAGRHDAALEP